MDSPQERTIDTILEHGVEFTATENLLFGLYHRKKTYHVKQPTLSCLLQIAKLTDKLELDEDMIAENPMGEAWNVILSNTRLMSMILATMILGTPLKIRLFRRILAVRLRNSLTPKQLINAVLMVVQVSNPGDFLNSIRLIRGVTMTLPKNLSRDIQGG